MDMWNRITTRVSSGDSKGSKGSKSSKGSKGSKGKKIDEGTSQLHPSSPGYLTLPTTRQQTQSSTNPIPAPTQTKPPKKRPIGARMTVRAPDYNIPVEDWPEMWKIHNEVNEQLPVNEDEEEEPEEIPDDDPEKTHSDHLIVGVSAGHAVSYHSEHYSHHASHSVPADEESHHLAPIQTEIQHELRSHHLTGPVDPYPNMREDRQGHYYDPHIGKGIERFEPSYLQRSGSIPPRHPTYYDPYSSSPPMYPPHQYPYPPPHYPSPPAYAPYPPYPYPPYSDMGRSSYSGPNPGYSFPTYSESTSSRLVDDLIDDNLKLVKLVQKQRKALVENSGPGAPSSGGRPSRGGRRNN